MKSASFQLSESLSPRPTRPGMPVHAVVNDGVKFAVCKLFGGGLAHVDGRTRIVVQFSVLPLPSLAWQVAQWSAKWRRAS